MVMLICKTKQLYIKDQFLVKQETMWQVWYSVKYEIIAAIDSTKVGQDKGCLFDEITNGAHFFYYGRGAG